MVKSAQVLVSSSAPTKLEDEGGKIAGEQVWITNQDAAISVFLGNSTVDATHGYELKAGKTVGPFALDDGDDPLYAKAASGTPRVDILAA